MRILPPFFPRFRRGASALVIVLACVIILSVLLLSYFAAMQLDRQATFNYGNTVKAQELARGAIEEVLGDLLKEIDAGSLPDGQPAGAGYTVDGVRAFIPAAPAAGQVARIGFPASAYSSGTNPISRSVLRVSRANDSFFSSPPSYYDSAKLPPNRASAVSSTNLSKNNRLFAADRWNATYLLGTNAAQVPDAFRTNAPHWVYVTRSGSRTFSGITGLMPSADQSATNQLLGRYAFVVYDEGALLDINAAGFPASAWTETNITNAAWVGTNAIRAKSFAAYADLTRLPGLTNQTNAVSALISWRSKGAITQKAGKYIPAVVASSTNGFLTFQPGDNPLLGRQDLIGYFKNTPALTNSLSALSCLGTFSRSATAPSWSPSTPTNSLYSPLPVDYAANAEKSTFFHPSEGVNGSANTPNPNRNLANLRVAGEGSRLHYRDDGSTETDTFKAGEAFLRRRFSLARLAWLGGSPISGPSDTSKTAAIRDCFGVRWGTDDLGNPAWVYDHGSSARILTLAEVANLGREPDFFELLKAAILSGSLGKNPGAPSTSTGWDPLSPYVARGFLGVAGMDFPTAMSVPDLQILQIGANIVDQSDSDGYPTAIFLNVFSGGDVSRGPLNTVYGQENLATISRIFSLNYEHKIGKLGGWYQPEIWNPNQAPTGTPISRPDRFRMTIYGTAYVHWQQKDDSTLDMLPKPSWAAWRGADGPPVTYTGAESESHIYFTDTGGTSSKFFDKPSLLTINNGGYHISGTSPNIWTSSTYFPTATASNNPYVAFWIGEADYGQNDGTLPGGIFTAAAPVQSNVQNIIYFQNGSLGREFVKAWNNPQGNMTFALEYSPDGGTTYLPYNWVSRIRGHYYNNGPLPQKRISDGGDSWPTMARTDPENAIHSLTRYAPAPGQAATTGWPWGDTYNSRADPRTDRFSMGNHQVDYGWPINSTTFYFDYNNMFQRAPAMGRAMPRPDGIGAEQANPRNGFFYPNISNWDNGGGMYGNDWAVNKAGLGTNPDTAFCVAYYCDSDGVVRPGDAYRANPVGPGTPGYGDGNMLWWRDKSGTALTQNGRRPVILNRPLRNIGELGYVYRDLPFKSLDFFSKDSADAALLDLFSISDEEPVVAGQINPNNAPVPVLTAVLAGAAMKDLDPINNISTTDAPAVAAAMAGFFSTNRPVANRAELVTAATSSGDLATAIFNALPVATGRANKAYAEAPVRAVAGVSSIRTWNLLIDVVAQSGKLAPNAAALGDFIVEGEKRYWLHVAIDRFTGRIVDQQLEPVYE